MAQPKKRYDICAGRPYGDDKKHWMQVGRLTEWDDGGLSIELHTVPTGNWFDGRLSVFEQRERQDTGNGTPRSNAPRPQRQAPATNRPQQEFVDDSMEDIPFATNRGNR